LPSTGEPGALARRGLGRAASGDHVKHTVRRRLANVDLERTLIVGLTFGQLGGSCYARREQGHRGSGDGLAGGLHAAGEFRVEPVDYCPLPEILNWTLVQQRNCLPAI